MKKYPHGYEYPTVDDNSAFDKFLAGDRSKLASFRKGVRWALMSAIKIWEPKRILGLLSLDASDARWVGELHLHQVRCGLHGSLPAVVYKISIDSLTD
eukprot:9045020-Heterocapsa_arctica.AAC.1